MYQEVSLLLCQTPNLAILILVQFMAHYSPVLENELAFYLHNESVHMRPDIRNSVNIIFELKS